MGSSKVFLALTWIASTVILCSLSAPVTEFFGPPQTIEGERYVDYPNYDEQNKVEEMERFHRTYKNGTVEFKMALSNGHVQYQRISTKLVDGDKIQVFEGYISEQYKDGRYGTRYYAADENGYRSSSVIIENEPPQLPTSGPYSSNLPRDVQNELSLLNKGDTQTKPKPLEDNVVEIENDREDEPLTYLNLGSNFSNETPIATTESVILKHQGGEELLENKYSEELTFNSNLPSSTELTSTTGSEDSNGNVSEASESSTILGDSSSGDVPLEFNTEQQTNEATTEAATIIDAIHSIAAEFSGGSQDSSTTSDTLTEEVEDIKVPNEDPIDSVPNLQVSTEQPIDEISEVTVGVLSNDEAPSTAQPTSYNTLSQETNTGVPEIVEAKAHDETPRALSYPLEDVESKLTTISLVDVVLSSSDEQSSLEDIEDGSTENIAFENTSSSNDRLPKTSSTPEIGNNIRNSDAFPTEKSNSGDISSEEPVVSVNSEVSTERSVVEGSEVTIDEVTSSKLSVSLNNEAHAPSTQVSVAELNNGRTDTDKTIFSENPQQNAESESTTDGTLENSAEEEVTEQPLLDIIEDVSTEIIAAPEVENKITFSPELPTEKTNSDEIGSEEPVVSFEDIIPNSKVRTAKSYDEVSTERSVDEGSEVTIDEVTSSELSVSLNNEAHARSTQVSVAELNNGRTDTDKTIFSENPQQNAESESTTDGTLENSAEEEVTEQPLLDIIEDVSTEIIAAPEVENKITFSPDLPTEKTNSGEIGIEEPVVSFEDIIPNSKVRTAKSYDDVSEVTTVKFLNDDLSLTEQSESLSHEALAPSTLVPVPALNDTITDTDALSISVSQQENGESASTTDDASKSSAEEIVTEQPTLDIIEDISTEHESASHYHTSTFASEIENKSIETNEFPTAKSSSGGLLLEDLFNSDDESSGQIPNDHQDISISEQKGRSLDYSTELPLPQNNLTSVVEGSGSVQETTNKIEVSTEQAESIEGVSTAITVSDENLNADTTTEGEVISNTQTNVLEDSSLNGNGDNVTEHNSQISTEHNLVSTSSEENSGEENKAISTEDTASTDLPEESSEEKDTTTDAEVSAIIEEKEANSSGVDVEFYPQVTHF